MVNISTDLSMPLPQAKSITGNEGILTLASVGVIYPQTPLLIPMDAANYKDGDTIIVEPRAENANQTWPTPRTCSIIDGNCQVINATDQPIIIGKDVRTIGIRTTDTTDTKQNQTSFVPDATGNQVSDIIMGKQDNTSYISINTSKISKEQLQEIKSIHNKYQDVFNSDISQGYTVPTRTLAYSRIVAYSI